MKWTACDESTSSSSDDDIQSILPNSPSDGKLSTIEESHLENGVESDSSSSTTRYSSFHSGSISNVSSLSCDQENSCQSRNSVDLFTEMIGSRQVHKEDSAASSHHRRHSDGAVEVVRSVLEIATIVPGLNEREDQTHSSQVIVSFMSNLRKFKMTLQFFFFRSTFQQISNTIRPTSTTTTTRTTWRMRS